MEYYFLLKWIHIISSTILFGTGLGIAFFMLAAYLKKNVGTIFHVAQIVTIADWFFTLPAVIIQLLSGLALMWILKYPFNSAWFIATVGLFSFVGACWLPVLWIQYQFKKEAGISLQSQEITQRFQRLMKVWTLLGVFAFLSMLVIFYLMVFKSGLNHTVF